MMRGSLILSMLVVAWLALPVAAEEGSPEGGSDPQPAGDDPSSSNSTAAPAQEPDDVTIAGCLKDPSSCAEALLQEVCQATTGLPVPVCNSVANHGYGPGHSATACSMYDGSQVCMAVPAPYATGGRVIVGSLWACVDLTQYDC